MADRLVNLGIDKWCLQAAMPKQQLDGPDIEIPAQEIGRHFDVSSIAGCDGDRGIEGWKMRHERKSVPVERGRGHNGLEVSAIKSRRRVAQASSQPDNASPSIGLAMK